MFKQYRLLYHSIVYTRPSQLYHRLRLLVKRKLLSNLATKSYAAKVSLPVEPNIPLASIPPPPLFKPRYGLIEISQNNELEVGFLNIWMPLQIPMNWHPLEMKKGTRLWLLNLHYMEFIEALDDSSWFGYIKDWINVNKPYKKGYWLDDWNSYSLSIRVVVWMQQFERRGNSLLEKDKLIFLKSLAAQIRFLVSNLEVDIGGNHLIKNIKALLWASRFYEGAEAIKWGEIGSKLLQKAIHEQVTSDGVHFELSPAYHAQVFADFLECYSVLDDGAVKDELEIILPKMAQFLTDVIHPDGFVSLFSDGGMNMSYAPQECLLIFEQLIGAKVQQAKIISYPNAGYFGLRCQDTLILMDAAELAPRYLPGHGHGDALSFEWSAAGQRVLIDPGVFEYNAGTLRSFSRSTLNHNTVSLDDEDQTEFWKAFRVGRRAHIISREVNIVDDGISVLAAHDGYTRLAGKPVHSRKILMTPNKIQIDDFILHGRGQRATSRLMLAPDIHIEKTGQQYFLRGNKLKIAIDCNYPISITETFCFLNFGHKHKTKQLVVDFGTAPCSCLMTLTICSVDNQ
ncbi:heparinase II/III family protein [Gammaproteobacteria bacterium]|nr:heparinase II/III family protein [Gammaproteobacteria bacterium]